MSSAPTGKKKTHTQQIYKEGEGLTVLLTTPYLDRSLTCWFGPCEDEGPSAAAPHLLIAGMEVNTVDSEGSQQGDLDVFSRDLVL